MAIRDEVLAQVGDRFAALLPHLNERQRRLALAVEARLLGHGGVGAVARIAGVSETTVRRGLSELEGGVGPWPEGRVRAPGGGRRRVENNDPVVLSALLGLVEPDERGDPESPLRWTTKSLRHLAEELTRQGHPASAPTVERLLRSAGFSLQANVKTLEGAQHPDRDAQFRYIHAQVKDHQADGEPAISVDTKKREQLGRLPMAGREWRPHGEPVEVEDHSFFFSGPEVEQAIPRLMSVAEPTDRSPYRGYRFLPEIIAHAVWLYFRFHLSFRDVQDLLAERGIVVSHESIRH
jgi:DDE family transposase